MEEASNSSNSSSTWTWEQEKAFENALAIYDENSSDRWERIAADVQGKSPEELRRHFELLMEDIDGIESGRVPLPSYVSSSEGSADEGGGKKGKSSHGKKLSKSDQEWRKGIAWTEDEHRLFLLGLEKYGKGDWRNISRNLVISRTPMQVANHAKKYFIRLNSMNKDITSVEKGDPSSPQGPIAGQTNGSATSSGNPAKQTSQVPAIGHLVSAVGTPVSLPPPSRIAYRLRFPATGTVVPGTPMTMGINPSPHTSVKR